MTYPILVSPIHARNVIIEFTSERSGRIILASPKAYISDYSGYMSPVGCFFDRWYACNDYSFNNGLMSNWTSPDTALFKLCPYISYTYPELLI